MSDDPLQIIEQGNKIIQQVYKTYPQFTEANEVMEQCKDIEKMQPDEITRLGGKLAGLIASCGDIVSRATARANSAYLYRKFSLRWEFNALSKEVYPTKGEREMKAEGLTEKQNVEEMVMRYVADTIKARYDSYKGMVSFLQSRIGILKNQMYSEVLSNENSQIRG